MAPNNCSVSFTALLAVFIPTFLIGGASSAHAQNNFFGDPGEYLVQGKPEAAARQLRRQAELGEAGAMFELANLYRAGTGVPRDPARGAALYEQAATKGHLDAQYMIGICYARGRGVDKDPEKARNWLQKAAGSGHANATALLVHLDQKLDQTVDPSDVTQLGDRIERGNTLAVGTLLDSGANPNSRDLMDTPMLHLAVAHRHSEIVALLVTHGADLSATDTNLDTALHIAAARGSEQDFKQLADAGADLNATNRAGWSARQIQLRRTPPAAEVATVSPAQRLRGYREDERFKDWSTLSIAAWLGDTTLTRELIEQGASMDRDASGVAPLTRAVQNGQAQTTQVLLDAGAKLGAPDSMALAPLVVATERPDLLALLIRHDVPLDRHDNRGNTALLNAIQASRQDLAEVLLDAGAGPGLASVDGVTPLMLAGSAGNAKLVTQLTQSGVDLSAVDARARNALHYVAASSCDPGVYTQLAGMLPMSADADGQWPLHLAAASGCLLLTEALLKRGHAVDVETAAGNTPLALSAALGSAETVQVLLSNGADPNRRDLQGETPLHRAARGGHRQAIEALLSSGANPSIRNNNARNAFDVSEDSDIHALLAGESPALFARSD